MSLSRNGLILLVVVAVLVLVARAAFGYGYQAGVLAVAEAARKNGAAEYTHKPDGAVEIRWVTQGK